MIFASPRFLGCLRLRWSFGILSAILARGRWERKVLTPEKAIATANHANYAEWEPGC